MSWKKIVLECKKIQCEREGDEFSIEDVEARLGSPLDERQISAIEELLGFGFSDEFRGMLGELEHAGDEYIYPIEMITSTNLNLSDIQERDGLYQSFDDLVFFGGPGNGDLFAVPVKGSGLEMGVYIWSHENDSRNRIAPSLESGLRKIYSTNEQQMLEWCR